MTGFRIIRKTRGFTLNELLVSIAILGILGGMLIANFSRGRLADELRLSSQTLVSKLRLVQNLATIGQALSSGDVPPGGYGIAIPWQLNQSSYILFSDTALPGPPCTPSNPNDANAQYDAGPSPCDQPTDEGTVNFRPSVVLSKIKVGANIYTYGGGSWNGGEPNVDITFKPPKPVPVLDGEPGVTIKLELHHLKSNQYRTITIVGPSGQISEQIGTVQ